MGKFDWIVLTILEIVCSIVALIGLVVLGVLMWKLLFGGGLT
jgi:hypothetical protein